MAKKQVDLTADGLLQVQEELDKLRLVERPRIIQAIKDARSQGDLSENADYDAAREEQAKTEARIKELEYIVDNANIIEKVDGEVGLGSTVTVEFVDDDEEEVYKVVGVTEVDVDNNMISKESPIGAALYGHKEGEVVEVKLPNGGGYEIKIVKIA
ncbi:MAG: transcription elongation factor GreA [Bacilli bacterium]|nr:transcription elongation factor GreA [Bacilli bacterium]